MPEKAMRMADLSGPLSGYCLYDYDTFLGLFNLLANPEGLHFSNTIKALFVKP
jgi:hypothetical protein